jgi:SAM-dependent methyltransferase
MNDTLRSRSFWDSEVAEPTHTSWLEHPRVRDYVNRLVGGGEPMWPLDWLQQWLGGRRFDRVLSIGCGTGALERDLVRRDIARRVDAFDGSLASLNIARAEAAALGMSDRIGYFACDFNLPRLPRGFYDAVFFHQSLHHVAKLERLMREVFHALKPDGVLYLDEYIGPSSTTWTPELAARHREAWALVPAEVRLMDELPYPISPLDPSEAIRSGEILEQMKVAFQIEELRPYGGNVLAAVYGRVLWDRADETLIDEMIARDAAAMVAGEVPYYAVILARPKRGVAARIASARLFVEPKIKRIGRELRKLVK